MKYILSILVFLSLVLYLYEVPPTPKSENNLVPNRSEKTRISDHSNTVIDVFDGVDIYDNGAITNTYGRNVTQNGYNLGLKWQCVEFVKRYYYEKFDHRMPDSYGHAKEFFDVKIGTGWNNTRGLQQFVNGSSLRPRPKSIIVFDGSESNPYGHIAIIAAVADDFITVAQQNWGKHTRMILPLKKIDNLYYVVNEDVLGWLSL